MNVTMKKIFALLLALVAVFCFASCSSEPQAEPVINETPADLTEKAEPETAPEQLSSDLPSENSYSVSLDQVERMIALVSPFNIAPQPFSDVSELTDETMVFASAILKNELFEMNDDGFSATLMLRDLTDGVSVLFGVDAALSEDFMSKDYSPYTIDAENETIVRQFATSGMQGYFFPYAVIGTNEEFKLFMIDLTDPLFFNDVGNQELLMTETEITFDMIEDIYTDMQCNVYTIKTNGSAYYLAGFEYINYKEREMYY